MMSRFAVRALGLLVAFAALSPSDAFGWSQKGRFGARVHGHEFDEVVVESDGCILRVALYFNAPESSYADKSVVRNNYRFDAKIELSDRRVIRTGTFQNGKPGRRRFRHSSDTSAEGCWAKREHKLQGLDVNGCRKRNCKVPEFDSR